MHRRGFIASLAAVASAPLLAHFTTQAHAAQIVAPPETPQTTHRSVFIPFGNDPTYSDGLAITCVPGMPETMIGVTNRSGRLVLFGSSLLLPDQSLHFAPGVCVPPRYISASRKSVAQALDSWVPLHVLAQALSYDAYRWDGTTYSR